MSRRFVITRVDVGGMTSTVCGVFEDHKMLEVQCIPLNAPKQILNNIYVGRVSQVVKNIGAAFVEIEKKMFFTSLGSQTTGLREAHL